MIEWGVAIGVAFAVVLAVARPALVPMFTDDAGVRAPGAAGAVDRRAASSRSAPWSSCSTASSSVPATSATSPRRCSRPRCSSSCPRSRRGRPCSTVASSWLWGAIALWIAARCADRRLALRRHRLAGHRRDAPMRRPCGRGTARASSDRGRSAPVPSADERSGGDEPTGSSTISQVEDRSSTGRRVVRIRTRRRGGDVEPGGELVPFPAVRCPDRRPW